MLLNAMMQPRAAAASCKRWSLNFYLFRSVDRHVDFSSPFLNSLADKPIAEAAQTLLRELRNRPVRTQKNEERTARAHAGSHAHARAGAVPARLAV